MIGPLIFGAIASAAGSQRVAMLSTAAFFVLGLIGMSFVDERRGIAAAEAWHASTRRRSTMRPERRIVRALKALTRLILRIFFRRVEVVGEERIPLGPSAGPGGQPRQRPGGPGADPRAAARLAAPAGQEHPVEEPARPALRWSGAGDPGLPPAGQGGHGAERGDLHPLPRGPERRRQRSRSSRRARATTSRPSSRSRRAWRGSSWERSASFPGLGTRIVPVGLTFDDKQSFRSRALVQVGEPIDPAPEIEMDGTDNPAAVKLPDRAGGSRASRRSP